MASASWRRGVVASWQPMRALLADLDGEFPPMRMFRLNREVRLSRDNSPYQLWVGATSESRAVGGTGYYQRVQASGLVTGAEPC